MGMVMLYSGVFSSMVPVFNVVAKSVFTITAIKSLSVFFFVFFNSAAKYLFFHITDVWSRDRPQLSFPDLRTTVEGAEISL